MKKNPVTLDESNLDISCDVLRSAQKTLDLLCSYDLYDVKSIIASLYQSSSLWVKLLRHGINFCELLFPVTIRKILRVKKTVSSASLSAVINMLCDIQNIDIDNKQLIISLVCELKQKKISTGSGRAGYGLPFGWMITKKYKTASGVANCHTSLLVARAYMQYYRLFKDKKILNEVKEIAEYVVTDLPRKSQKNGGVSLSYTQFDDTEVINISAEAASFLQEAFVLFGDSTYSRLANKLMVFVWEKQFPDGSWLYSANSVGGDNDNYHTMMNIRSILKLINLGSNVQDNRIAIIKAVTFYLDNFFDSGFQPKEMPHKTYPISAYTCAESLYGLSLLVTQDIFDLEMREKLRKTLIGVRNYIVFNFMKKNGVFITRKYKYYNYSIHSCRRAQAYITNGLINCSKLGLDD